MSKRYQGGILGVGFNPLRAPNAPTIGTATAGGNNCASVAFTAPACVGGSAITSYTAQSNTGGFSGAAAGSPITVSGLTNGQSYTFGVFALNSYGPSPISAFSNSITAAQEGTFAVFALGAQSTMNKYTYSGCVSAVTTSTPIGNFLRGSAAGNSSVGIYAYGNGAAGPGCTGRFKYTWSSDAVGSATNATAGTYLGAATSNSTTAIFATGNGATTRNKYTYSGDVNASAAASSVGMYAGAAAGTSTVAIFQMGAFVGGARNKYTYASDTNGSATAVGSENYGGAAAGNSTRGIFSIGFTNLCCYCKTAARQKYTYSGDVVTSATSATVASALQSAAGNGVVGIFALGCGAGSARNKYTYSGCVNAAATASSNGGYLGAAASNGISGVTY